MKHIADIVNPSLGTTGEVYKDQGAAYISRLISVLITTLLIAGSVAFLIYFLLGAIAWITSSGDKTKAEEARSKLSTALIGIVIMFSAWAVFQFVEFLFGLDLLAIDLSVLVL